MKSIILLICFVSASIGGWAQESKPSEEKSLAPIVIEGNVERVPDGTVLWLSVRDYKFTSWSSVAKDTIEGGKFRFEYVPKKAEDEYYLNTIGMRRGIRLYATSGTTTTVSGVGVDYENWYIKNDNPLQKEANEYRAYLDEKIPGYFDLRRRYEWINNDDDEYYSVKRKWKKADSLYVERMTEYMQDKKFSPVFSYYLWSVSVRILISRNKGQRAKAAKLLAIAPKVEKREEEEYVYTARQQLQPKYEPLKIGEKLHDFVLYDHDGKEHHLTEFNGNGKYLLLEFNSRSCVGCMKHRPKEVLDNLYKNHSDKVDMLLVNIDDPYYWNIECKDPNKYGRDPWHEWNDRKGSEDIMQRYGTETGVYYFFVSPDGIILGKITDERRLEESIKKFFKI